MGRTFKKKSFAGRAGRRSTFRKSSMSARKAAFTALRKVKSVERKIERKTAVTIDTGSLNVNQANGTYNLNESIVGVATGDGRDHREGNKISPSSFKFHGDIIWHSLAGNDQWLRLVIVQDLRTIQGSGPTIFIGDTDKDVIDNNGFLSEFNLQTRNRYRVLYNKHFKYNTAKDIAEPVYFTGRIKLPKTVEYNGSAATDLSKNGVWALAWGSTSATTTPIKLRLYGRMWYTDL